jgi:serine/threonine-protein kinase
LKDAERERLESEAGAAKKLQHANIATLYDFGVEDNQLVYVTEDIKGTLAEDWVNAQGPLPITTVLRIAMQVVNGLAAALFQQVVHRAINPANLVLAHGQTAEGEWPLVKILHFVGGAPPLSDTGGTVASFDKSLRYVSPEQIKDGTTDFRSEIYSLGCTMWFLLTGVTAIAGAERFNALRTSHRAHKDQSRSKKIPTLARPNVGVGSGRAPRQSARPLP